MAAKNAMEDAVRRMLSEHLGEKLVALAPHSSGANSVVYKATTSAGTGYCVKKYLDKPGDGRDRLSTEYNALDFLLKNGIHQTPRALCRDEEQGIGIYEYIVGEHIRPGEVGNEEVSRAVDFAGSLYRLSTAEEAEHQPVASEACFSLDDYVSAVNRRGERLRAITVVDALDRELLHMLEGDLVPFFEESVAFALSEAEKFGMASSEALPEGLRMLSPSDFGFQNVLKRPDGSLAFIDFEYFGWDDPAKLLADFFLQPAVPVPEDLREEAYGRLDWLSPDDRLFSKRFPLAYLLSAFKWCLIMLNVFLHGSEEIGYNDKTMQLHKATHFIERTREELARRVFPLALLK